jgi:hypothetical protein
MFDVLEALTASIIKKKTAGISETPALWPVSYVAVTLKQYSYSH